MPIKRSTEAKNRPLRKRDSHSFVVGIAQLEELQSAIRTAAREAGPEETSREVAARVFEADGETFRPFELIWVVDRLAGLIAKYRRRARRAVDPQYILGLGRVPKKFTLRSGEVIDRDESTVEGFRQLATQLRALRHPALDQVEKTIALMEKRTVRGGKPVLWKDVRAEEAAKL